MTDTNTMRDKIARIIQRPARGEYDEAIYVNERSTYTADAIIENFPSMVPPLVWDGVVAQSCGGEYILERELEYGWGFWSPTCDIDADPYRGHHKSEDAAKAAANTHNAAQIMKGLGL